MDYGVRFTIKDLSAAVVNGGLTLLQIADINLKNSEQIDLYSNTKFNLKITKI